MFSGEFRHSIDEKGRIIIPAKFRPFLQNGMFLTRGLDGCLFLFPLSILNEIVNRVEELPLTNPTARAFSRLLLSGEECQMDKLGRILIPSHLREFAGLDESVVIIGQGKRIEIWSEKRWNELVERFRKEEIPFAEQFRELGI